MKSIIRAGVAIFLVAVIIIYFIKVRLVKIRQKKLLARVDDAEDNINVYLNDKKDLIISTKDKFGEDYENDFKDINFSNYEGRELDNLLSTLNNKFNDELIDDEKLLKNDDIKKLYDDIRDNNSSLLAAKKFYNDTVKEYNDLKKFSHGTHLFCHFKNLKLWDIKETNSNK